MSKTEATTRASIYGEADAPIAIGADGRLTGIDEPIEESGRVG